MSDMADVIRIHSQIGRDENGQYCKGCGNHYGYAAERTLHRKASAHVAHMLSAAGFGPVQEAPDLKRVRGELKTIGKNLDSWESQDHTSVTIRDVRRCLQSLNAAVAERGGQ